MHVFSARFKLLCYGNMLFDRHLWQINSRSIISFFGLLGFKVVYLFVSCILSVNFQQNYYTTTHNCSLHFEWVHYTAFCALWWGFQCIKESFLSRSTSSLSCKQWLRPIPSHSNLYNSTFFQKGNWRSIDWAWTFVLVLGSNQ